jgi:hypothetical protein
MLTKLHCPLDAAQRIVNRYLNLLYLGIKNALEGVNTASADEVRSNDMQAIKHFFRMVYAHLLHTSMNQ